MGVRVAEFWSEKGRVAGSPRKVVVRHPDIRMSVEQRHCVIQKLPRKSIRRVYLEIHFGA